MAERKSGPVKPPVIDLTARPAGPAMPESPVEGAASAPPEEKSAPENKAAPEGTTTPDAKVPPEGMAPPEEKAKPEDKAGTGIGKNSANATRQQAMPRRAPAGGPVALGAIGGAVIAIAICYGLASAGYWPAPNADMDLRLAQLQDRLAQAETAATANAKAVADINTHMDGLQNDLTSRLGAASAAVDRLQQSVQALQAAKPPSVDLSPLEAQVKTLSSRLDAVAAGASSADAGAIAANLATAQQNLADLTRKVGAIDTHLTATDSTVSGLKSELDSAKAAIDKAAAAPSPRAIASAMQLPLLISALEADFATGHPYAADLAKLTAAVPEAHVPASLTDAAATGLPAPGELARQLDAAMPDILAARPPSTDSSWQGQLSDWAQRVLALRPQGAQPGDTPAAIASRLQQAVDRHDFASAATLFGQLPQPMQQAAGDLGARIKALADADAFVAGLRQTALAPAAGAQQ